MRLKCIVSYDGTNFNGYQVQPQKRTVQAEIEAALMKLHKGKSIKIHASGRTDAGVHAVGQVFHFDTDLSIPEEKWPLAINNLLPKDIVVISASYTESDFHARFHAKSKQYRYFINTDKYPDVFKRQFSYHYPFSLNIDAMKKAAAYLCGTHDFTSFCVAKTEVEDKIRTIYSIDIIKKGTEIIFCFTGNGFLYNMVRILVGTLLEIGQGMRDPSSISGILEGRNRSLGGKTAPGHGLYLWEVKYDN